MTDPTKIPDEVVESIAKQYWEDGHGAPWSAIHESTRAQCRAFARKALAAAGFAELPPNHPHRTRCLWAVTKGGLTLCQPPKSQRALLDEIAELREDAERYRYFITGEWTSFDYEYANKVRLENAKDFDPPKYQDGWYKTESEAIDAARKGG